MSLNFKILNLLIFIVSVFFLVIGFLKKKFFNFLLKVKKIISENLIFDLFIQNK